MKKIRGIYYTCHEYVVFAELQCVGRDVYALCLTQPRACGR